MWPKMASFWLGPEMILSWRTRILLHLSTKYRDYVHVLPYLDYKA